MDGEESHCKEKGQVNEGQKKTFNTKRDYAAMQAGRQGNENVRQNSMDGNGYHVRLYRYEKRGF